MAPRRSTSRLDTCGKPPRQTRRLPLHHTTLLGISRSHRSFPPHRSTSPYRTPRKSPRNQLPRCSSVFLRGKPRTGLGCLYRPYWNKCQLGNPCSSRAESHRALPRTSLRGTPYRPYSSLSLWINGTCLLGKHCSCPAPSHPLWANTCPPRILCTPPPIPRPPPSPGTQDELKGGRAEHKKCIRSQCTQLQNANTQAWC